MAVIRFLDGKQRGKTATVDDEAVRREGRYRFKKTDLTAKGGRVYYLKAVRREGRYRFKKTDLTAKGGRVYYLKAVPKKRWVEKKVPEWTAALDDDRVD